MEYFHSNLADLQPEKQFINNKGLCLALFFFQNSLSVENFVATDSFLYTWIKLVNQKFY